MEESQIRKGRGRPRKTIRRTIRKDLEVDKFDPNMVYDRTIRLGCCCYCCCYFVSLNVPWIVTIYMNRSCRFDKYGAEFAEQAVLNQVMAS